MTGRLLVALLVLGAILPAPAGAQARSSFCSESGDLCYGVDARPLTLSLALAARYFTTYGCA